MDSTVWHSKNHPLRVQRVSIGFVLQRYSYALGRWDYVECDASPEPLIEQAKADEKRREQKPARRRSA